MQKDNIQSAKPSPNEIWFLSDHDWGQLTLCLYVYMCVHVSVLLFIVSLLSNVFQRVLLWRNKCEG